MSNNAHAMLLILVMTAGTMATRFLPFLLLGDKRQTPAFIRYLGQVLPYAIMGMLVVYCLKGVSMTQLSSVLPAALGVGITAGLHLWKHNTLLSIIGGTVCYMILVQMVF
ncbi:MAG: AzlD domain-containing protein [Clostridia bacterium]|nr:AzlD domain-containing protein [Clostridia bacterium]